MRGKGEGGGVWVVVGGTGEIDRVTTQCEAKQAAAAQTSTHRGAIGCRLLVFLGLWEEGKMGGRSSGNMYARVHI